METKKKKKKIQQENINSSHRAFMTTKEVKCVVYLAGIMSLLHTLLGEIDIGPPSEAILLVPRAFPVANEYDLVLAGHVQRRLKLTRSAKQSLLDPAQ
jgi:hypothetical protein